jgi:predicted phage tail protein
LCYFEIYEPALASGQVKVQYEIRAMEVKTGQTIVDTGLRSAESDVNPGKLIIPIAEGIAFKKLHTGAYRVEVQASDSTGKQTPWRSASFTVE